MRYILARANLPVLRQFARSNVLVALDYDGTLAPIVTDPDRATLRLSTRALLEEVARRYPCAVISGRAQGDALQRLKGMGVLEVVGNHGVEPWHASPRFLREVRRWRPTLEGRLAGLPGVTIEDKAFSVAVHYRRSREKQRVRAAIHEAAASLGPVRVIRGKQVVNLLPAGAPHKGLALEKARRQFGCDAAIYVGDDETDEDVFALDQPGHLLTIRVGRRPGSLAAYYLRGQAEIDDLLRVLLKLRQPAGARRGAALRPRPQS